MAWWWLVLGLNYALALVAVVRVLLRRREPLVMVVAILAILGVPILGMLVYWLLSSGRLRRKSRRRRRRLAHLLTNLRGHTAEHALQGDGVAEDQLPEDLRGLERLGRTLADTPATGGNDVGVYLEANATYAALEDAIRAARHHVHMEYYIWRPDETGLHFRDLLVKRAREGIECRVLLDAAGCWGLTPGFLRPLRDAGVHVAFFLPLFQFPFGRRWSLHLRNHRKIVVVDGQVTFLGSQNIGDEYRGRLRRLSPWHDTHMRIDGPAALLIQQVFAEDWYLATRERLDRMPYFGVPRRPGRSIVQILATGPDQRASVLSQMLFAAVSSARSIIRIATPYFAPASAERMALAHACYRGVRVQLVLPERSDVRLALWGARSFYGELLEAGLEIYEYEGGVLHSKVVNVDDRWSLVGSANMDARSFRMNYEVSALVYDAEVAAGLGRSIEGFRCRSRRIALHDTYSQPLWRALGEGAARLFTPLL